jgi:hypothetical protein
VNNKCCYCKVETSRSNNGSAAKWQATQAHRMGPPSAEACSTSVLGCNTHYLWKQSQHNNCYVGNITKWVSMAKQPHTTLRSQCAVPSVGWSGVKLGASGLWSSLNAFSGLMNHTSPSDRRIWVWWMPGTVFPWIWLGPLVPVVNLNTAA